MKEHSEDDESESDLLSLRLSDTDENKENNQETQNSALICVSCHREASNFVENGVCQTCSTRMDMLNHNSADNRTAQDMLELLESSFDKQEVPDYDSLPSDCLFKCLQCPFKTKDSAEMITFDYKYERYGQEAQRCECESINCRGWLGGNPDEAVTSEVEGEEEEEESSTEESSEDSEEEQEVEVKLDKFTISEEVNLLDCNFGLLLLLF